MLDAGICWRFPSEKSEPIPLVSNCHVISILILLFWASEGFDGGRLSNVNLCSTVFDKSSYAVKVAPFKNQSANSIALPCMYLHRLA
jgi:hypothetical protein